MKRTATLLCLLLVFCLPALAQVPGSLALSDEMGEVHAGYSYISTEQGLHGFQISAAYRATPWLGLVGDFSGHYGSEETLLFDVQSNVHNFMVGPRGYFEIPDYPRWRPYAHLLFGVSRLHTESEAAGVSFTDSAFAWALGGGVDYALTENVAGRLVQLDYIRTRYGDAGQNNLRIGIGLVYRFGR